MVFNGINSQFTHQDFLNGTPMSHAEGATDAAFGLIPGEGELFKSFEKFGVKKLEELAAKHAEQLKKYGQAGFRELQNGRFRYYGKVKPAANAGEMQVARLVREWNPATGKTRTWYETLDQSRNIRQVHPKYNNLSHYKFNVNGKYIGKW